MRIWTVEIWGQSLTEGWRKQIISRNAPHALRLAVAEWKEATQLDEESITWISVEGHSPNPDNIIGE